MVKHLNTRDFTFFDVETPNSGNDSICAIGVIHVKENDITFKQEYLINPETRFDNMNMEIHGITPRMVEQAPKFPEVWSEIQGFFTNGVVIAHNATFDLSVITKTLLTYDIPIPEFNFICTLGKARRHISKNEYGGYKLNVLCDALHINLEKHHNALSDAFACKELFNVLESRYGIDNCDIKVYAMASECLDNTKKSVVQKAVNSIYGIIYGIGCDQKIRKEEFKAIYDWMEENKAINNNTELKECFTLLHEVLADEYITYSEYNSLMECFKTYKTSNLFSDNTLAMQVLMGIIKGIEADREVNTEEGKALHKWMEEHEALRGNYPFDKIFDTLTIVLENNIIDKDEERLLLDIFSRFTHPEKVECKELNISGKICCLTGNFYNGTKADVEKFIACKGGSCVPGVNQSVDYLVVGGQGSCDWKYGNYGSKVSKAIHMQEKGAKIQIISEDMLYRMKSYGNCINENH